VGLGAVGFGPVWLGRVGHGFKGAVRKAQAFVWDKERGLVTIINSSVL